jgi:hypothetical protein
MESMSDDMRRHLRAGFELAAEDYQRTRPVCPPQLFDVLMLLAGLKAGDRVMEIGCAWRIYAGMTGMSGKAEVRKWPRS